MSFFEIYFQLGFDHISQINSFDHILFLVALSSGYVIKQWRKILILVTAFTVGHSLTLALATLSIIIIPSAIIEFLIPLTILITCIANIIWRKREISERKHNIKYAITVIFGLIHGLGFSNVLRSLLGSEDGLVTSLLAFNIGVELGQIFIVVITLLISSLIINWGKIKKQYWNVSISSIAGVFSFYFMAVRLPDLLTKLHIITN